MHWIQYFIIPVVIFGVFILLVVVDRKTLAVILGTIIGLIVVFFLKRRHEGKALNALADEAMEKIKKKENTVIYFTDEQVKKKRKEIANAKRKDIINNFINTFGGNSK